MTNLTLKIDDELLRRARVKALEEGTSVTAVVREHLSRYVETDGPREAMARFLAATEDLDAGSGPGGRTWTREEIYEAMLDERSPAPLR